MELIVRVAEGDIAQKSYDLFHIVMQAPAPLAYSEEKKWDASRLTMHGAYKSDKFLPWVEDPQDILTFLDYHFNLAIGGGKNQDEPIQDALCALANASGPVTIEALKDFNPTNPSFVRGICYAYQSNKPLKLRRAAFFFLPLISDKFFNTPHPIMEPDQMKNFCVDWASTVDCFGFTDDVKDAALTVLFGMINSPHWRPHILAEKWKLLEHSTSVPDDSQPLRRCIDNPDLIDAIKDMDNPAVLSLWLKILWLKEKELIPEVRGKLEAITREDPHGKERADLERALESMQAELREAEEALSRYDTRSTDPDAVALRKRILDLGMGVSTLIGARWGAGGPG